MSEKMVTPRILSGFLELLPEDQILFNQMMDIIREGYESYGFLPLDTPTIELSSVLLAKAGDETEKQIYRFQKGDNDLSLRFDLTVPLARYAAMHEMDLAFPFKRYQIGKVFRGERPQHGRFREFYQCDIDVIGLENLSLYYDAEMPAIIYQIFTKLNFGPFVIHLNNRKLLNGFFEALELRSKAGEILRLVDKLEKIGEENLKKELLSIGISEEKLAIILSFLTMEGSNREKLDFAKTFFADNPVYVEGLEELQQVCDNLSLLGVPEEAYTIDFSIARGLDYYTGTVYETRLVDHPELGSVCSGGRYDNLTAYYTKQNMPGIGISIGLSRLFAQLKEANIIQAKKKTLLDVLIIPMGEEQIRDALKAATFFRARGLKADVYYENKGMKPKMKYAARLGVPFAALIGEEEAREGKIALKNMDTSEQNLMTPEEALPLLKA